MIGNLLHSDARFIPLADSSVNCVVTSPPYWGLRDYGLEPGVWGGDEGCEHSFALVDKKSHSGGLNGSGLQGAPPGIERRPKWKEGFCRCGAWRGVLGLEPTPEMFVQHIVEVFREVWRVLRKDGTLWLNLGDSYYQGNKGNSGEIDPRNKQYSNAGSLATRRGEFIGQNRILHPSIAAEMGLKPKDLVGIPWRVAFALQADGWYLRSDIIWSKPNPMPESVTDRPTKAHEYLFLLAKSGKYYFDAEAVKESLLESSVNRVMQPTFDQQTGEEKDYGHRTNSSRSARKALCNLKEKLVAQEKWGDRHAGWEARDKSIGRNIRTVWTIATQPYRGSHFATFPEKLVEPCILAGCPAGGIVFDPFGGSGTVGRVAERLNRQWICADLKYHELSAKRITGVQKELLECINPIKRRPDGRSDPRHSVLRFATGRKWGWRAG